MNGAGYTGGDVEEPAHHCSLGFGARNSAQGGPAEAALVAAEPA